MAGREVVFSPLLDLPARRPLRREFAAPTGVDTLTTDAPADKPKRNRRRKPVEPIEAAVEVPVPAADYVPAPRFVPTPEQAAAIEAKYNARSEDLSRPSEPSVYFDKQTVEPVRGGLGPSFGII